MVVKVREVPPGSGHWYVKVGCRQRRVARCFSSEECATELAQKLTTALDLYGLHAPRILRRQEAPTPPTVAAYAAKWAQELESRGLKRSTVIWESLMRRDVGELPDLRWDWVFLPLVTWTVEGRKRSFSLNEGRAILSAFTATTIADGWRGF